MDTAVVIVNYRTKELTRDAVKSVLSEPEVAQVVVIDNGSADGSATYLRDAFADARVRVVESPENRGFGPGINMASASCDAPFMFILNSDATLVAGSMGPLTRALRQDEAVGVVAPAVYESDGKTPQPGSYGRLPGRRDVVLRRHSADAGQATSPGWVSGVAMLLRRDDFLAVGGFDEGFEMYLEDVDLCRRLREMGKAVRREPAAAVVHHGGRSFRSKHDQVRRFHASKARYFEKIGATRAELWCIRLAGRVRIRTASARQ